MFEKKYYYIDSVGTPHSDKNVYIKAELDMMFIDDISDRIIKNRVKIIQLLQNYEGSKG